MARRLVIAELKQKRFTTVPFESGGVEAVIGVILLTPLSYLRRLESPRLESHERG